MYVSQSHYWRFMYFEFTFKCYLHKHMVSQSEIFCLHFLKVNIYWYDKKVHKSTWRIQHEIPKTMHFVGLSDNGNQLSFTWTFVYTVTYICNRTRSCLVWEYIYILSVCHTMYQERQRPLFRFLYKC